jgi:hypothetical protein
VPVERHHSHSETHNGFVPESQLADGTATAGYVVTATGTGEAEWAEGGGGGGSTCDHQHETEEFVAAGGAGDTFTLTETPMFGVRVYVQGLRASGADVTVTGLDVQLTTVAGDAVIIDYEAACAGPIPGGIIYDGDPVGSGNTIAWYYVCTEAEWAALTPGGWAAATFYNAGDLIFEDGSYFIRAPEAGHVSGGSEPTWTTPTEGQSIADGPDFGYWVRLPDAFLLSDPLTAWAPNANFASGLPDDKAFPMAVGGHVYVADTSDPTSMTQPDFPTDPCAGIDTMYVGNTWVGDPGATYFLARPYVGSTVVLTRNGSPETVTETDSAGAIVNVDATTWANDDILVFTYTADCP